MIDFDGGKSGGDEDIDGGGFMRIVDGKEDA